MKSLGEYLKELRGKESLRDASKRIGISHTYLDTIEKGFDKRSGKHVNPTPETLKLISKAYACEYEELMKFAGYLNNDTKPSTLSKKDERDIAKKLESILGDLNNGTSLAFNGEPMDDHTRELVRAQIESNLRVAKEMARKKFTPKKYQTDDND